ncbi:MAG: calcium/sodium antiporter [Paludibacteraceae bacterium]|jgi:cation:H+ antiporter|nr:calcium/sodium antiporter [Paludibacteraceae bacterium]MEE0912052.1 calcium/sodium antiporter [Paludibacteraceae bacterium]
MEYLMLIGGLALLILSGNFLVNTASDIARRLKLSSLVIGLTIVAFGTSAPELLVSTSAALGGHPEIALGNVLGSNIANIGFIAGLTALLLPFFVTKKIITLDIKVMILLALLFALLAMDGEFSRWEGIIVFLILVIYTIVLLRMSKGESEENEIEKPERSLWLNIPLLIASLAGLAFGSDLMVDGASTIASSLGVSERVISVTIVAVGTSLPEFTASIISVLKKEVGITIGNLIGSNIFNIGAVLGISSIIQPIQFDFNVFLTDTLWMIGYSILLLIGLLNVTRNFRLMRETGKVSALWSAQEGEVGRIWGATALILYIGYIVLLLL